MARAIDLSLALLVLYVVARLVPGERTVARALVVGGALTAYEALFVTHLRATPGKLATALRVAPLDRVDVDPVAAWVRGGIVTAATLALIALPAAIGVMTDSIAGFALGATVVAVLGAAALSTLTSPLRRNVADRAADTVVVPFEAPAIVDRAAVEAESAAVAPRPITPWGPVATFDARRSGRVARLDDSPALVLLLVAVVVAWAADAAPVAIVGACAWAAAVIVTEAVAVARDGGTAGHRRAGTAVLDESTGEAPRFGASLARSVVLGVFWLFPPLLPVLVLWLRLSPSGRGPHDLVAGTVVVELTRGAT